MFELNTIGELAFHLHACELMMPYYFAASHWNYARDGLNYIRMMKKLPMKAFDSFLEGQHVLHLTDGIFNGIWSDMGIETTYMKHGKGPSGIVGITTNERAVRVWSNGHHLRGAVLNELESLRNTTEKSK